MKKFFKRSIAVLACTSLFVGVLTGCSIKDLSSLNEKRIIRISHTQSEKHPINVAMLAFEEYIEERLGDKYDVQVFPNALLGDVQKSIELTQTGAIDFVVASTANLETFSDVYEIYSMPYLFNSVEAYHAAMNNRDYMENIYKSTEDAGFEVLTWYESGSRNMYCKEPINTPDDLKGKKIRVQQSPASIAMCQALGAAASPMSFGEVYTAIQQGVIDGAENNEMALTDNKHGEVIKYYSYDMHQMIPDMLVANLKFINGLDENERKIFEEAALYSTDVQLEEWDKQVAEAKEIAQNEMGVTFIYPDKALFMEKVAPLQEEMLANNPAITDIYDYIQGVNAQFEGGEN